MNLNKTRLHNRIESLSKIGRTAEGGSRRIALTDADKAGRDLVISWMQESGLQVQIDQIGNIFATLKGKKSGQPIMTGSHIDTVGNGGHLDGCYGVLAGLEILATYADHEVMPNRDLCVAIFTNEEGVRFQPDMLGSLVYAGGITVDEAHAIVSTDGKTLHEELIRTGFLGTKKCGSVIPYAFIELHIEQGPILESKNDFIGVVEGVQGISWTGVTFRGQSNHAGTTPMNLRKDAAYAASSLALSVREITKEIGEGQVGTVGVITPKPNLINVVPGEVKMTVDLRNIDDERLKKAEKILHEEIENICRQEKVIAETEKLVRFEPVQFNMRICSLIADVTENEGISYSRLNSGAGHDAQMMARICPTAMIFVPSKAGISHNPKEYTAKEFLDVGADILFKTMKRIDHDDI
ncbi:MAG: M20 family metallo-hydrolase [Alphaproteobacteria bacterium]|nr:M20 family metallo-hydrolase [Alphaproteobacteria bacterium]HPF45442.1 M20 family metallo-hydrolase [Emcibacteraceae bacterium]